MPGRRGISKLGPEERRERARKAALARWGDLSEVRLRERVEWLIRAVRCRPGSEFHVRNLERLLRWLEEG